jgi:hypothetical protein
LSLIFRICASVNRASSVSTVEVDLVVLVATWLAFETTGCSILLSNLEAVFLPLIAFDREASLLGVAGTAVDFLTKAVIFFSEFAAVLPAGTVFVAVFVVVFAGGVTFFTAPDLVAATAFDWGVALGNFTVLFAGVFFAGLGSALILSAGLIVLVNALTIPSPIVFAEDLAGTLPAGFVRVAAITLGANFFVLLADFLTVAFIVPCPQ